MMEANWTEISNLSLISVCWSVRGISVLAVALWTRSIIVPVCRKAVCSCHNRWPVQESKVTLGGFYSRRLETSTPFKMSSNCSYSLYVYLWECQMMLIGDWRNFTVLQAVAELRKAGLEMNFSFLNYAQSSQCRNWQDSSVSYAAGALIVHWGQLLREPLQRHHSALNIYRHNLSHSPYLTPSYAHNLQEGQRHSKPIQFCQSLSALLHPAFSLKCP